MLAPLAFALTLPLVASQASQPAAPDRGPSSQPAAPSSQPAADAMPSSMPASQPATTVPEAAPPDEQIDEAESGEHGEQADASTWLDRFFGPQTAAPLSAGAVTSRPGFSENAATLPMGGMLLNASVNLESDIDTGLVLSATALEVPELMVRVGVLDYLELRMGGAWRLDALAQDENFDEPPPVSAGIGRFSVGGTARILEERGYWPAAAVILQADVPLRTLRLGDFSAFGKVAVQKTFLERFGVAANAGANWNGGSERFSFPFTMLASVSIGLGVGAYAEVFGDVYVDALPVVWADGGLYYDVSERVRVDALVGVNAFGSRGDWLAQVGLSWLIAGS